MLTVEPDFTVPIPHDIVHENPKDLHDRVTFAFNTVQFLAENGLPTVEITEKDKKMALKEFTSGKNNTSVTMTSGKAVMLKALLSEYDMEVVRSAVQLRNYVKLRLLELSSCGRESTELRALELLGKLAEINAFSENINVTVEHKSTKELEQELASKLTSYLDEVVDVDVVEESSALAENVDSILPSPEEVLGEV